jgi:hypothetical protein
VIIWALTHHLYFIENQEQEKSIAVEMIQIQQITVQEKEALV